jgi:hypothetical protein
MSLIHQLVRRHTPKNSLGMQRYRIAYNLEESLRKALVNHPFSMCDVTYQQT